MTYRAMLADYIDRTADWRAEKARQYPLDLRNKRAEKALRALADSIMEDESGILSALAELRDKSLPYLGLSAEGERVCARYGFSRELSTPGAFFDALFATESNALRQDPTRDPRSADARPQRPSS